MIAMPDLTLRWGTALGLYWLLAMLFYGVLILAMHLASGAGVDAAAAAWMPLALLPRISHTAGWSGEVASLLPSLAMTYYGFTHPPPMLLDYGVFIQHPTLSIATLLATFGAGIGLMLLVATTTARLWPRCVR